MIDYLSGPVVHEAFFKKYASKKFLKGMHYFTSFTNTANLFQHLSFFGSGLKTTLFLLVTLLKKRLLSPPSPRTRACAKTTSLLRHSRSLAQESQGLSLPQLLAVDVRIPTGSKIYDCIQASLFAFASWLYHLPVGV
jgi:hypothetical protein